MTTQRSLGISVMVVGLLLPAACEQTLRTGRVGNTTNAPAPDGTCPAGLTVCGKGVYAQCLDLQNDRAHCGACDNACLPGIACQAGACQQVACTGAVTVSTQTVPAGGGNPDAILADVNGDGRPDLVSWGMLDEKNYPVNAFEVALGKAGGGFAAATSYQTSRYPHSIVAYDSNHDGVQDLYIVCGDISSSLCEVEIWRGHADGNLTSASRGADIAGCWDAVLVDLNGDGEPDLLADTTNAPPTLFFADANGGFHTGTFVGCSGPAWDWNGDGFPDLVKLNSTFGVCLNRGNGTFDDATDCAIATSGIPAGPSAVIADFNRDGHPDLATAMDANVDILLGRGGCQFQPMMEYPLPEGVRALVSGDVNGDGFLDLVAWTKDDTVSLLLGGPDGAFQVVPFSVAGGGPLAGGSLMVGDVTGDGKVDIVFVAGNGLGLGVVEDGGITTGPGTAGSTQILGNTCP